MRFEGVYKITCIPNGKAYIGQSENVLKRWKSHFYEANKNKHINKELQEDINKYGITNFTFEILSNSIEDELFFIEKFKDSVKLYNSLLEKRRDLKELKNGSNLSKNERDAEIIKLKKEGFKVSEIAKVLSITDTTIYNVLKINSLKNGL